VGELDHELWVGDPAEIRARAVRRQVKTSPHRIDGWVAFPSKLRGHRPAPQLQPWYDSSGRCNIRQGRPGYSQSRNIQSHQRLTELSARQFREEIQDSLTEGDQRLEGGKNLAKDVPADRQIATEVEDRQSNRQFPSPSPQESARRLTPPISGIFSPFGARKFMVARLAYSCSWLCCFQAHRREWCHRTT
jgi:hypothetical protein